MHYTLSPTSMTAVSASTVARSNLIVHVQDIIPVPMCDPSIAGLFALRSRVLTLIDTQYLVTGAARKAEKGALAVVVDIAGHQYGLLVDKVEDVVSILPEQIETQNQAFDRMDRAG